jgi:hypothetical protein
MKIRAMILPAMVALSCLALGVGARADLTLNTPAGLNPGDQFRFVFVTDGVTQSESSQITDYDTFVNAQAGGATYNGTTVSWLAIGSTASVNAIDHIGAAPIQGVYLPDGTNVTTSTTTTGLWSGTLTHAIDESISGSQNSTYVWTGTNSDGTVSAFSLGDPTSVTLGETFAKDPSWVNGDTEDHRVDRPMYGISGILTVPGTTAVPEPSTAVVAAFGAVALLPYSWSRHRREQRRQAAI